MTPHDIQLAETFVLRFNTPAARQGAPGARQDERVDFQFPPRVTSDSRSSSWSEGMQRGDEPITDFQTSGPRMITIAWCYIVEAQTNGRGGWSRERIKSQVLKVRGYYARLRENAKAGGGESRDALIVRLKMWMIGGATEMTAYLKSVDVKYGETMLGAGNQAYPLRTDITAEVRLWSKADIDKEQQVVDVKGLAEALPVDWY